MADDCSQQWRNGMLGMSCELRKRRRRIIAIEFQLSVIRAARETKLPLPDCKEEEEEEGKKESGRCTAFSFSQQTTCFWCFR